MNSFMSSTSYLYGTNAPFMEALFESYQGDPSSVPEEWRGYFERLSKAPQRSSNAPVSKQVGVYRLIDAYRSRGMLIADLDPLKLRENNKEPTLDPAFYGLTKADEEEEFDVGDFADGQPLKLGDLIIRLKKIYAHTLGTEFGHILETEQREWLQHRLEQDQRHYQFSPEKKKRMLDRVTAAETMERYLGNKYVGQKRFGLEGGESFIAGFDHLIQTSSAFQVREIVVGMAHRGRLNVLVNLMGKKTEELFEEFESRQKMALSSGDVKYHNGYNANIPTSDGPVNVSLAFNPSHLEIVNPVVIGSVRARQQRRKDKERIQVLPVLVHGDSALSSLGVNQGVLNLSQTRGYGVGGAVHVVINNQVGFTTSYPRDMRSTQFCTDIAKMVSAPVFHVHGDDVEQVCYAFQLALEFRMAFKKDVFIDIVCFRKLGHNEGDDPKLTQPLMYQKVAVHPGTRAVYAASLVSQNIMISDEPEALIQKYRDAMDRGESLTKTVDNPALKNLGPDWSRYVGGNAWVVPTNSSVMKERLKSLGEKVGKAPEGMKLHPTVARLLQGRIEMAHGIQPCDWGMAETLAYATLVEDGVSVRISGEDSGRGTFAHRHAVIHDQSANTPDGRTYIPLQHISDKQGEFEIIDSILNEEAILAYEHGFACAAPEQLVIWEGQFGDFANGAQVAIDQFISSSEAKWGVLSRLVLNLPHGYDGQGPEHSSARVERWLQLCAESNMVLIQPSRSSQMFHALRRHMLRPSIKPLVIFMSKRLLRYKDSMSGLEEFSTGGFHDVLGDESITDPNTVKRVIFCTGQIWYDLDKARTAAGKQKEIALLRLEQLYPFPSEALRSEVAKFVRADTFVWAQEEPENQGAWVQIRYQLGKVINNAPLHYAGRPESAAPAVGYSNKHKEQLDQLLMDAIGK